MTPKQQKNTPPKPPGKLSQAGHSVFHAVWPYLAAFAGAVIIAVVTGWGWVLALVAGVVLCHAALRVHEATSWHFRGGRAAARKRRRYQGPASRREIRAKLSLHAIRQRAHVTRPATERPRQLPAGELGVLIGTTLRRPR